MKTMGRLSLAVGFTAFLLWSAGCKTVDSWRVSAGKGGTPTETETVKPGPPDHAPAVGYRAKHQYRYYPDQRIYFDSERNLYFFLSGDGWEVSASLPYGTSVAGARYVEISMDSETPYMENAEHQEKYPPGQAKKKDKGNKGKGRGPYKEK